VSYSIVNPLIAVLLGMALGGEKPVRYAGVAVPLIVVGLVLMFWGDGLVKRISASSAHGRSDLP
jgi:EamA domain-containing membrane protein RarD